MNKYTVVLSLILICGCIENTATIDGRPINIINDKNGNPYVIQYIDTNTGKILYSKNINTDPGIIDKIVYTTPIPYTYIIVFTAIIIIIYLVLKIWKLGKDENE